MKTTIIGIAEWSIVRAPDKISTLGLGSCCGVVLYDSLFKIAGMVHVMLPTASAAKVLTNPAKYADTGVELLLEQMLKEGARKSAIAAKLAGGAHMFAHANMQSDLLKVGERNVQVCHEALRKARIPLVSEDVLGTHGRTITFDPATGSLHIRTVGLGEKDI
ncbi:chemotaxis protein CheD [Eubacteriales bacterium OttesenSCG-928-K08]|nr:chemotaxis protein CheD [Eubacteriales bacterium OttesenSCG-928-K08]